MSTSPARELHGRDAELALIRAELERLSDGAEAVLIVEGAAGMGKSRLLAEVSTIARSLGIRVGSSAADPSETVVELAVLLAALFDGAEPLLDDSGLTALHAHPEQRFWLLRDLQQLLERAALESPLLISIDDAHWADGGTAAAIRTLPMRLVGLPIAWVIALRPPRESTPLVHALEKLRQNGARTIVLGPLDENAIAQLATDVLAAQPDQSILEQLTEADGNPFLVVETLLGLQEENRIRFVDGRAELIDNQLPRRVQQKMRERLGRLSDEASDAATVAASLGRTFSFDELARTLGRPASDLLAPVGELLEANLLVERDEKLAFWHDITREAVRASVPVTARRALDRQAAGVLLEAGALPVEVAVQLAASAEPGDEVAIETLLEAAEALVTTDPDTAATFGRRALEIAPAHHPRRGEIVGTTAIALHITGNSEEAIAFADQALRETLPATQEAEVRLSIAGMFAISPEIRISAGRLALSLPDLSQTLRARHLACLFHNLVTAGRVNEARAMLEEARAAVASADDARASFTLRVAESALDYTDDRFDPSLELITSAYRDGIFAGDDQRLRLAHMWHGELLSVADRDDEALAIASDGLAAAQRDRQGWAYQMFETWHGRMLLRTGRLTEARRGTRGTLRTRRRNTCGRRARRRRNRRARTTGDPHRRHAPGSPPRRHRRGHARTGHTRGAAPRSLAARALRAGRRRRRSGTRLAPRSDRTGRPSDPPAVPARHRRRGAARSHRTRLTRRRARAACALQQPTASRAEPRHRLHRGNGGPCPRSGCAKHSGSSRGGRSLRAHTATARAGGRTRRLGR